MPRQPPTRSSIPASPTIPAQKPTINHTNTNLNLGARALTVCELYAGLAAMTATLQSLGWTACMMCELAPHLRLLLENKYPDASVLPDMNSKPWLEWEGAGLTALLIVAGVSCQPFSAAGRMLGKIDPRSMDALKVLEAALHLETRYILLENVPEYVTNDTSHGVFSLVKSEYQKAGFQLHSITERRHASCGGHTSRVRLFILFTHTSVKAAPSIPEPITALMMPRIEGHHSSNWTTRGSLKPYPHGVASSGLRPTHYLQLGGSSISEGSIVTLPTDRSVLWKVRGISGADLLLRSQDPSSPSRLLTVHHTLISEHLTCPESKYTVYSPSSTLPMLRSFGDPPGMGGPLVMLSPSDVRSLSTSDRCGLQEVPLADAEFLATLGCTDADIWQALGNTIPASMVLGNLMHITDAALTRTGAVQPQRSCSTPSTIYFYHERCPSYGWMSQFYCSTFIEGGSTFHWAEQFMMAEKASLFADSSSLELIMAATSPGAVKALGRGVAHFDQKTWEQHRFEIVLRGCRLKFTHSEALSTRLVSTHPSILAEAAPNDKIWGIGISARAAEAGQPWAGLNLLGKALMLVRTELLEATRELPEERHQSRKQAQSHTQDGPPQHQKRPTDAPQAPLKKQRRAGTKKQLPQKSPQRDQDLLFLKRVASDALNASAHPTAQRPPLLPPRAPDWARDVTAPINPGHHRILFIPVHVPTATAWLAQGNGNAALSIDALQSACGRGNLTKHTSHLMGPWAEPNSLALAGHYQLEGTYMSVVTVAVIDTALLGCILEPYKLAQLDLLHTEIPASLAIATSKSHGPNNLCLGDIAPIAISTEAWGGATAPKRLRPTRIGNGVAAAAPDILDRLHDIEACLSRDLATAEAAARLAGDEGLASYCSEWQMQVTAMDFKGIPHSMLASLPTFEDARLASIPFSRCSELPATEELPSVPNQTVDHDFVPDSEADILTDEAIRALNEADAKSLAYIKLQSAPGITEDQLKLARPAPVFLGQDAFQPKAKGRVYDMRGPKPVLQDMNADIKTHLNREYFARRAGSIPWVARDKQLMQQVDSGIRSQTTLPLQFRNMPPLISLAAGVPNVGSDLLRLRGLGYIQQHQSRPFLPMFLNPQGARAKKGTSKLRRISEMGAPRKAAVDTEGVNVEPFNVNAKFFPDGSLKLPQQVMPRPEDVMTDASILRHIGDLTQQPLVAWTDDLKDFFNQLKLHPSELHRMCFNWQDLDDPDGTLKTIVETVLGFGHVFASNIAQRFSNAVVQIFLAEFDKMDAPFLEADRARYPVLDAWVQHRSQLDSHSEQYNQARLLAANMYCDDLLAQVVGTQRAVRAKVCWYRVTRTLNLLTAEPRKRLTGLRIPWTGLEYLPMLGIILIPEAKTTAALAVLALAERGRCEVGTAYRPLMGLIQFLRYVLRLPRTTVAWMLEPLRSGNEIDSGPSTWVRPSPERKTQWREWRQRLISTHCASYTTVLPETQNPPLTTRAAAWHGDAALAGTVAPGMCGHCHGLYWIFSLRSRHLRLTIAALEFLTVVGNFLMFGPLYTSGQPAKKEDLVILLQCDSLVSTHVLSNDAAKDRVLLFIHMQLLQLPEFCSLQDAVIVGHEWGERNVLTDHGSRGREDNLIACCAAFGTKAQRVPIHPGFTTIVERTVAFMSDSPCNEQHTGSAHEP